MVLEALKLPSMFLCGSDLKEVLVRVEVLQSIDEDSPTSDIEPEPTREVGNGTDEL